LCLWNCTFDPFGEENQSLRNMTFTSWVGVSSATLVLPQNSSTLTSLRLGHVIPSTSLKLTALFREGSTVLTYLGGSLQLMEMNANFLSFSLTGGSFSPSPDSELFKVMVDPLRIEGISPDMIVSMESQSQKDQATMDLKAAKGYAMMMVTGFNDVSPLPLTEEATD
ncbi:hypothetical protein PMAYCL1PPCAC_17894, partial [Pristionchus mayeri]